MVLLLTGSQDYLKINFSKMDRLHQFVSAYSADDIYLIEENEDKQFQAIVRCRHVLSTSSTDKTKTISSFLSIIIQTALI